MRNVLVASTGSTALVCARAEWGEVLYLNKAGQQGAPTAQPEQFLGEYGSRRA